MVCLRDRWTKQERGGADVIRSEDLRGQLEWAGSKPGDEHLPQMLNSEVTQDSQGHFRPLDPR